MHPTPATYTGPLNSPHACIPHVATYIGRHEGGRAVVGLEDGHVLLQVPALTVQHLWGVGGRRRGGWMGGWVGGWLAGWASLVPSHLPRVVEHPLVGRLPVEIDVLPEERRAVLLELALVLSRRRRKRSIERGERVKRVCGGVVLRGW